MIRKLSVVTISCWLIVTGYSSCQSEQEMTYKRYYAYGKTLYEQHCMNCHGAQGQGLNALIPPLTDTVFLKKNRDQLPGIIKNGLSGKIIIHGKEYEGEMPGNSTLTPIDIAEIATYITNSFGNKQGMYNNE